MLFAAGDLRRQMRWEGINGLQVNRVRLGWGPHGLGGQERGQSLGRLRGHG